MLKCLFLKKDNPRTLYNDGLKHIKDSKERLFIRTQTHSLQILGVISFVKLQKRQLNKS